MGARRPARGVCPCWACLHFCPSVHDQRRPPSQTSVRNSPSITRIRSWAYQRGRSQLIQSRSCSLLASLCTELGRYCSDVVVSSRTEPNLASCGQPAGMLGARLSCLGVGVGVAAACGVGYARTPQTPLQRTLATSRGNVVLDVEPLNSATNAACVQISTRSGRSMESKCYGEWYSAES